MSAWRRKAIEFLPDERILIQSAENQMDLWIDLQYLFQNLAEVCDYKKIRSIFDYASWCIGIESGKLPNDTSTAVVCAFYENFITNKKIWPILHNWISVDEFEKIKCFFNYHLSDNELKELDSIYSESIQTKKDNKFEETQ